MDFVKKLQVIVCIEVHKYLHCYLVCKKQIVYNKNNEAKNYA